MVFPLETGEGKQSSLLPWRHGSPADSWPLRAGFCGTAVLSQTSQWCFQTPPWKGSDSPSAASHHPNAERLEASDLIRDPGLTRHRCTTRFYWFSSIAAGEGGRCGRQKFSKPYAPVMALGPRNPTAAKEETYVFYTLTGSPSGMRGEPQCPPPIPLAPCKGQTFI